MNNHFDFKSSSSWPTISRVFIGLLIITMAFLAGSYSASKGDLNKTIDIFQGSVLNKPKVSGDIDFKLFWDVWNTLKRDYVDQDKLTEKKLFYGALRGLVGATDDPYSVFMNPQEAREFQEDLSGTFEGIGAEIGFRNDILTIIAPLDDMPAVKAGLRAGDKIYAIDNQPAAGLTVDEAVKKIRGPKGTKVTLTIVRDKVDKPLDIAITRDTVVVKSVKTGFDDKTKIFTIKITNFNDDTEYLFTNAVQDALVKKPKGIILDLRNNPGGYLETAVLVASEWIKSGPVVIEQFSDEQKIEHQSNGTARLNGIPIVVLINQGSASASEIVAGALKDYKLATLIGEKTFGKGSVQVLRQLEDGSVVKVTTAEWLTPNGNSINEQGIEPDVKIEFSSEARDQGKDPQLEEAIKLLTANN